MTPLNQDEKRKRLPLAPVAAIYSTGLRATLSQQIGVDNFTQALLVGSFGASAGHWLATNPPLTRPFQILSRQDPNNLCSLNIRRWRSNPLDGEERQLG